uniref:Uncharacterized protein n=1 Tax=Arion vulgaris TaxID=1028688 RepID=A0A0B7AJF7_9EUPU
MLNSLATYLWGSTATEEQDCAGNVTLEQHCVNGENLETLQEEDWVVVKTASEIITSDQQEERENIEVSEQPLENDQLLNDEGQAWAESNVLQQRNHLNHAAVHHGLVSEEQLVRNIHLAQRLQYNKVQKLISNTKCERQNKVREGQSTCKGNSRRNKRIRPSGFRSSRFNQRF